MLELPLLSILEGALTTSKTRNPCYSFHGAPNSATLKEVNTTGTPDIFCSALVLIAWIQICYYLLFMSLFWVLISPSYSYTSQPICESWFWFPNACHISGRLLLFSDNLILCNTSIHLYPYLPSELEGGSFIFHSLQLNIWKLFLCSRCCPPPFSSP